MPLTHEAPSFSNAVTALGPGFVVIGQQRHSTPLVVMAERLLSPWLVGDPALPTAEDFAPVLEMAPELVLFGCGAVFRFPDQRIPMAFYQRRIGFEVMDTAAACRTFNLLAAEGRHVAAALLV
ncbi:MAG TPA: Mth938-like domain-containing protein [Usitatibacteraceae bacterium]|nr:Mth938-like domain-containing protein [Usitatibacteraceae bacterium]